MTVKLTREEWVKIADDAAPRVAIGWLMRAYRPGGRRPADWMIYRADRSGPLISEDGWKAIWVKGTAEVAATLAVEILAAETAKPPESA